VLFRSFVRRANRGKHASEFGLALAAEIIRTQSHAAFHADDLIAVEVVHLDNTGVIELCRIRGRCDKPFKALSMNAVLIEEYGLRVPPAYPAFQFALEQLPEDAKKILPCKKDGTHCLRFLHVRAGSRAPQGEGVGGGDHRLHRSRYLDHIRRLRPAFTSHQLLLRTLTLR